MTISKEQIEQTKQQVLEQIETTFPEDKKETAKEQIQAMNDEEFEEFLIQNNLISKEGNEENKEEGTQQCVFCSIISGKIPSHKISENKNAIAVLEINPISKGHTIIIPKPHVQEVSQETQNFAKEISEKIKEKLKAREIKIENSEIFGHKTINLIPIYDDETLKGIRKPAPKKDLENLQKELFMTFEPIEKIEEEKEQEQITEKNTWLPKRIP